jgi:hypothetical protein
MSAIEEIGQFLRRERSGAAGGSAVAGPDGRSAGGGAPTTPAAYPTR